MLSSVFSRKDFVSSGRELEGAAGPIGSFARLLAPRKCTSTGRKKGFYAKLFSFLEFGMK